MTDKLDDMRRRAAQQAGYGNYWAGKCVALIDRIRELEQGPADSGGVPRSEDREGCGRTRIRETP